MSIIWKTAHKKHLKTQQTRLAVLLVLFLLLRIQPLYTETLLDEEPCAVLQPGEDAVDDAPLDDTLLLERDIIFIEELFLFDEFFSFSTFMLDDETMDGQAIASETLSNETQDDELYSPGVPPDEGAILDAETLSVELDEMLDESTLVFEAPPLLFETPEYQMRSLDDIFPTFTWMQKLVAMSTLGLRNSFTRDEYPLLAPNPDLEIDLLSMVMKKNPSHLIEALAIIPYHGREFDLLDIYNALGRIGKIKDYPSTIDGFDFYVFTESTRIESSRNRRAISDPLRTETLPFSETLYLRLKEINYGNLYIRGDISISSYGITYSMTNFTDVRFFIIPIMRAERFISVLYLEPVEEGILIYSLTGFYLPGYIASRVDLTPNINRRIQIFTNWIVDGLRSQEGKSLE